MTKTLWNVHESPWWHAPTERRFEAYYMNLRVHYGMEAAAAFARAKNAFTNSPAFMADPAGTIRAAITYIPWYTAEDEGRV
jgi:hypothetical protein